MKNFYHIFTQSPLKENLYNVTFETGLPPSPPSFSFLVDNFGTRLIDNNKYALVGNQ